MMDNNIIYNIMMDFKKKDIDKRARAEMIEHYCKTNKISLREFARKFEIPHSTIQDWHMYLKLENKEITKLKEIGYTDKEVYVLLRNHKKLPKEEIFDFNINNTLSRKLNEFTVYLKSIEKKISYSSNIVDQIKKTKDHLNRVLMYVEK